MAKVKGPLYGFRAQGKIKKEYIFQDHLHWKICKVYREAPNPRTPAQVEIRNTMLGLIKEWQKLTDRDKEAWNDYCNKFYKKTQSGYSLFLKLNFDYFKNTGKVNKYPPGYAPPGPIMEGLAAWFKFDEGQGTKTYDAVNNIEGIIYNATWTEGKKGNALYFNGTNAYVWVAHNTLFNFTTGMTIEAWVKLDEINRYHAIAIKGSSSNFSFDFYITSGNRLYFVLRTTTLYICQSTITLTSQDVNKFIHIVALYDGQKMRVYKDAQKWGEASATGNIATNTLDLYIAYRYTSTYRLKGVIDELRFYNRALTEEEIQYNYNL